MALTSKDKRLIAQLEKVVQKAKEAQYEAGVAVEIVREQDEWHILGVHDHMEELKLVVRHIEKSIDYIKKEAGDGNEV